MERDFPTRLTATEGRKFAFPVGLAFLLLGGIFLWRDHDRVALVLATVSGALLLAGLLVPTRLGPVFRGWMAFAHALSRITTPIFMGITFFIVITPIGILMRVLGRNPVVRTEVDGTYWVSRSGAKARGSDLKRQF